MASKTKSIEWTQYEVLLPQPSFSKCGNTFELMTGNKPMVRSILRSHAYERVVSVEEQDRKWASMARPISRHQTEKDPAVVAWKHRVADRRAEERADPTSARDPSYPARTLQGPFARRRPAEPLQEQPAMPTPHPKSTLPNLERRLARERRRAGEKPKDHPSITDPERYSETPVHRRAANRKVFEIPAEVARERSIITSGRRFTWGGRQKLALPGFNPHRERQLREKVAKF